MTDPRHVLHIYGPDSPHDTVFLLGTREALLSLRAGLDVVLAQENPAAFRVDAYCADGEGFATILATAEETQLQELCLPYTNDIFVSRGSGPWQRPDILRLFKQTPT
jgi:hypothetical protein